MMISFVNAAGLSEDSKIEIFSDFSGGLNTQSKAHKMSKEFSRNMLNVLIDEKPGSIIKRKGSIVSGSTTTLSKISFMFTFNKEDGSKEYLISDSSIVLTTKDFNLYTTVKTGLNSILPLKARQLRNKVWFTNGSDSVFTYDGSTTVVLSGATNGGIATPNVPKGKYIETYHERIWLFNISDNNSALRFSALSSTDGVAIAPDDSRAWPVANQLNVGQGDGTIGMGLKVFKSQIYPFKEDSIYTVFGTNEDTYFPWKTDAQVGTLSENSIVVLDNLLYFLGKDGIYSFDGSVSNRISDLISDDIEAIRNETSQIVVNIWDTKVEFDRGTYSGLSTASVGGFIETFSSKTVQIITEEGGLSGFADFTLEPNVVFEYSLNNQDFQAEDGLSFFPEPSFLGFPKNYSLWVNCGGAGACGVGSPLDVGISNKSLSTVGSTVTIEPTAGLGFTKYNFDFSGVTSHLFSSSEISSSSVTIRVLNRGGANKIIKRPDNSTGNYWSTGIGFRPQLFGQFISEVSTITTITSWGAFDPTFNTNGGSVQFFVRTATSSVNISTYSWIPITPGSIIRSSSTDTRVQWASTITSVSEDVRTNIDRVDVQHIEGASNNISPFAINWKNRYWLSVSTQADDTISLIYVKSKITNSNPNAWMKFSGVNIRSFTKSGSDIFYAGSSTSGIINRLDFGTNDNGLAIDAFYETSHSVLGNNFFNKKLVELLVDADKENNANLTVGISVDSNSFVDRNIDLDGSGLLLKSIYDIDMLGKIFSFRFRNAELDKGLSMNTFGVIFIPLGSR